MTDGPEPGPRLEFPANWDVLRDGDGDPSAADAGDPDPGSPNAPPILTLVAASWGDAVAALAVCTASLAVLTMDDLAVDAAALPWAAALGAVWWLAAAAAVVVVRQGTPGMLLAGVAFAGRVSPARLVGVLAAALLHAALLGLPSLLGPRRSPLALAAGCPIRLASA
jgi:hypothetical protein